MLRKDGGVVRRLFAGATWLLFAIIAGVTCGSFYKTWHAKKDISARIPLKVKIASVHTDTVSEVLPGHPEIGATDAGGDVVDTPAKDLATPTHDVTQTTSQSRPITAAELGTTNLATCGKSFLKGIRPEDLAESPSTEQTKLAKGFGILGIPRSELPKAMGEDGRVASCALVSSGGSIRGTGAGKEIDQHDLVFRMNAGGAVIPLTIAEDAGRRTNILFWNHPDMVKKCFFEDNDDFRRCVPHALFPGAEAPKEKLQFLVGLLTTRIQLSQFLRAREKLGSEAWRLQAFDNDYKRVLPRRLKYWSNAGWGASAGMVAFWMASTICRNISTYGFKGVVTGTSYHAYAWCDVDRILKVRTNDCSNVQAQKARRLGAERSEFGFKRAMQGHNFDAEKKLMEMYRRPECLKDCFANWCNKSTKS